MDAQKIVNEINRKLNGEFEIVEFGTDDWQTIVSALNENIDLYNKSANWRSSYDPMYTVGTVTSETSYKLKSDAIAAISGNDRTNVLFYDSNNVIVERYKFVSQEIFDQAENDAAMVTLNRRGLQIKPQTEENKIFGTSIVIPAYINVKSVTNSTDTIRTDDNYWLIMRTAADLASTSPVDFIARNFDSLEKAADKRMKRMKKENRVTQSSTPAYGGWNPLGGITNR